MPRPHSTNQQEMGYLNTDPNATLFTFQYAVGDDSLERFGACPREQRVSRVEEEKL